MCLSSQTKLTKLHITCEGTIEKDGYGMLQVKHRGGNIGLVKKKSSVVVGTKLMTFDFIQTIVLPSVLSVSAL